MDRISQISLNTMRLLTDNQKITAANLANLNTIGFRRDVNTAIGSAFLQDPKSYEDRVFARRGEAGVDTSVSSLISTDRPLDIAISGSGFIVATNEKGEKILTRRGDMTVRADGKLKLGDGSLVQGGGGDLVIPPHEKIEIGQDGTISYKPVGAEGNTLVTAGRIDLVNIAASNVVRGLDGYLRPKNGQFPASDANVKIVNNSLETSNVNAVESMVEIIQTQRSYEMQIKLIHTAKDLDDQTSKLMRASS
jgi:flagellar basal-body rod protein FlgF